MAAFPVNHKNHMMGIHKEKQREIKNSWYIKKKKKHWQKKYGIVMLDRLTEGNAQNSFSKQQQQRVFCITIQP